jgi:hypothetical protein
MQTVKYGDFEISPDVQKTKEYYSNLTVEETQTSRNFRKYCENMAEEEKAFFESFGILPDAVSIYGKYYKGEKRFYCGGTLLLYGKYEKAYFYPQVTAEQLSDENFMASLKDPRVQVGNFLFTFKNNEENAEEDSIFVDFSCRNFPWLLDEKPQKDILAYEPPKKWEVHKRVWNAVKAKKSSFDHKRESIKFIEETLTASGLEFRRMGKHEYERYREEWVKRFTPDFTDEKKAYERCLGERNFLWHLFSYGHAHATEGEAAAAEFDEIKKCKSILLCNYEEKGYVLSHSFKLKAETLEEFADVTVTSANFAWTYCKTHECDLGPYFYRPKKKKI